MSVELSDEDIQIVKSDVENGEYTKHVKFLSLEGFEITWKPEQAQELKKQILENQGIRKAVEMRLDMAKTLKDNDMILLFTDILRGR